MARFRAISLVSITLTIAAVAMWGLAIGWTAARTSLTALPLDRSGAIAVTGLAGLCWALLAVLAWVVRPLRAAERDRAALIRTLAALAPASAATRRPTRPHDPQLPHRAPWQASSPPRR